MTIRFRTLRVALGMVLSLHIALMPIAPAHAGMAGSTVPASASTLMTSCHEAPATTMPTPASHHAPCCELGQCQCVAVSMVAAPLIPQLHFTVRAVLNSSVVIVGMPSTTPTRALRPPILA